MILFGVVAIIGYLVGSFPAGYLAGRLAKIDIRQHGSGNIGATNVTRVLGKLYGYPVFVLDFLKGLGAVRLSIFIAKNQPGAQSLQLVALVAAVFCVLGHSFPIWLGFRGGKGVASFIGALFGITPVASLIVIVVWIIVFWLTRYVSVASMTAAVALPIAVEIMMQIKKTDDRTLFYFSVGMAAIIIVRHRANLVRLMNSTEPRFRKKNEDR